MATTRDAAITEARRQSLPNPILVSTSDRNPIYGVELGDVYYAPNWHRGPYAGEILAHILRCDRVLTSGSAVRY